jgi:uroporphyrinogen-III synthase
MPDFHHKGRIVVTRPAAQGVDFVGKFIQNVDVKGISGGIESNISQYFHLSPVIGIHQMPVDAGQIGAPEVLAGVIVTSAHALHAGVVKCHALCKLPFFVVGESVARQIRNFGVRDIRMVAPTIDILLARMGGDFYPHAAGVDMERPSSGGMPEGEFLYLRGADVTMDLERVLPVGRIRSCISYEAVPAARLPDDLLRALAAGEIGAVTFFSTRTANIFMNLAKQAGVLGDLERIKALCISSGVLECVLPVFKDNASAADTPDIEGMLNLVQKFLITGYTKDEQEIK